MDIVQSQVSELACDSFDASVCGMEIIMNKKQKKMLYRIISSFVLLAGMMVMEKTGPVSELGKWPWGLLAYAVPYAVIGWDIVYKAIRNILHGQVFDENFLMMVATAGAFVIGEYEEAAAVMLFYQVGELFQSYAVNKSRKSISDMMDICPEYANIEVDGALEQVDPDEVSVDTVIVIKPGERIPLDGVVVDGESMIDTSALTGESVPRGVHVGSEVISGCINGSGLIRVRVTKEFDDSTVAKILELVENASSRKANVENFVTRFARYYTPVVVGGAVLLAVVPPIVLGDGFLDWMYRACTFLVISCPCALVISVPLSFFGGIGAASGIGVLVKGSNFLEALSQMDTIVFDKTGTLTKGEFTVTELRPADGVTEEELLLKAAHAECFSNHPIGMSVRDAYEKKSGHSIEHTKVKQAEELSGRGVKIRLDGKTVSAGNEKLMAESGVHFTACDSVGTVVYVAEDGRFLGTVVISDTIKEGSAEAIEALKSNGVRRTVMLTGDRKAVGEAVAESLGLDEVFTELLPGDKVREVERLLAEEGAKHKLAFVGDGINDAPVLTRADSGIAMGWMGADAAIEAADIVLMDDDTRKIAAASRIARKTMGIVKQNITFALAVKFLVLFLGAVGYANMWAAVFADVGVSLIAILNAMRCLVVSK